jgi:parallel beta-helix repeat protein
MRIAISQFQVRSGMVILSFMAIAVAMPGQVASTYLAESQSSTSAPLEFATPERAVTMPGRAVTALVQAPATNSVKLSPGDNIQSAVNAAPAGTTFELQAGTYRMQSIQPKNNDIFIGVGSVILTGSQVLSFKADPAVGGLWTASATAGAAATGVCQSAYPLSGYNQDLFIDSALQTPVSTSKGLKAGEWYFDRSANTVYIPVNPSGHTVELGMEEFAFSGTASGVQVESLTVEEYATPAQLGAVGAYKDGSGWIVNHVESRWNHGTGISLGPSGQILNSFIHNNGQTGIDIVNGANSQVIGNEISWNNYAGYATNWEAGGSKFWNTTNLLVESNYVHDNMGNGLWTDDNNVGTVYENNTVVNNLNAGILHEISYNAVITGNTVEGNGNASNSLLWNSQIELANSQNVLVYGNTIEVPVVGGNGIGLINESRGTGTLGVWVASNNYVHNNTITHLGAVGDSGIEENAGAPTPVGNRFDYNQYILKDAGSVHWAWISQMTWKELQAAGQETHGSLSN